jgi:hypothetical protein
MQSDYLRAMILFEHSFAFLSGSKNRRHIIGEAHVLHEVR